MPSLGLSTTKAGGIVSSYERDGLKLYMPYNSPKEVKFVGQGSTEFDGTGDYIDCGDPIISGTGDYTFIAWIKKGTDTSSVRNIAGNYAGGDGLQGIQFGISAAEKFQTYTDGTNDYVTGATDIPLNVWTHVASTRSSNNAVVYVNGVSDATGTLDNDIGHVDFDFTIGANPGGGEPFTGSIKNVAVWNRALSATEIQNVMYKTYADLSGTLSSGLVSWWALESDYLDSTSSDNDGTANGDPVQTSSLYGGVTPLIPRGVDNAPTVQADAIGTGYANFDDDEEYIDFGDVALGTSDFSISMWAYSDDWDKDTVGDTYILSRYLDGSNYWYIYTDGSKRLVFTAVVGGSTKINQTATFALTNKQWHHITIVADVSSDIKFYVDGVLVFSASDSSSGADLDDNASTLRLGTLVGTTSGFLGRVKNLGIWLGLLTQAQIQSIMEKTYSELISSEKTNLVSWWGLDTNANDEHGSNNGTLS